MTSATGSKRSELFERLVRAMHCAESPRAVLDLFVGIIAEAYGPVCYAELVQDDVAPGRFAVTRLRRDDGTEVVPDRSPFRVAGATTSSRGLFGRIVNGPQKPALVRDIAVSADDPFAQDLAGYRSMLALPIYTQGHPEWIVLMARDAETFDSESLDDFLLRANLVGAMLTSMTTAARLSEAEGRLRAEVQRIAEIQRQLLPAAAPLLSNLEIAFCVTTYDQAGGDFVDFEKIGERDLGMIIADASGHGPSAAVVAAMVSVIIRAYGPLPGGRTSARGRRGPGPGNGRLMAAGPTDRTAELAGAAGARRAEAEVERANGVEDTGGDEPWERGERGVIPGRLAEVLTFANAHLCEKRIEESFVTAFVAAWDADTRTLEYARAGHPPPMLRSAATGEVSEIRDAAGLPLGIFPEAAYTSASMTLYPGDLVLAFTDGIAEAQNVEGEQFGEARIAAVLKEASSAADALARVTRAVAAFTGAQPAGDDRTLLAFRVTG